MIRLRKAFVGCGAALLLAAGAAPVQAANPTPTNFGNNARTGWYSNQPSLTPDYVQSPRFGAIFSTQVDGPVMSQPIVTKGKLIVTTLTNSVYALDPVTGDVKWRKNLGRGFDAGLSPVLCSDLQPYAGGLSTPAIDQTGTGTIYTTVKVGGGTGYPYGSVVVHALDVSTGTERAGFPEVLSGIADNRSFRFDGLYELQRPGLLYQDGGVYIATGGMCDAGNYQGWVFRVNQKGVTTGRWVAVPIRKKGAGIWQAGSGLASDGARTVLFATGNGIGDHATPGPKPIPGRTPPPGLGESVVRLSLTPLGKLKVKDFFSPADALVLDKADSDFASGGPVVLPASFGTPATPRLLSVIGKAGILYTLDRDALGGYKMGPDQSNAAVSMGSQRNGVWGKPSIFGGDGGWLYATTFGRIDFYRRAVTAGRPGFSLCANTVSDQVGIGSSSPVVTSNASDPASALVWAVTMPFRDGQGAQLRAYRGNPACGAELTSFRQWAVGQGSRYASPGVGDGRIYVGTTDSHVIGYGSPAPDPVLATGTDLGVGVAGTTIDRNVTLTASAAEDISSITIEGDTNFSLVDPQPALPVHLAEGETVTVPVRFAATVPGMRGATMKVVTSLGDVLVSLNAKGRAVDPYLNISTPIVSFGNVPKGLFQYQPLTLVNNGSQTLVISKFDVVDMVGGQIEPPDVSLPITIAPGARLTTNFRYTAVTAGAYSGQLRLSTNGSEPAANRTIQFSGFGARIGNLSIKPSGTIDFGRVKVGQMASKILTFRNLGEVPLVLNKYKPPAEGPFSLSTQLDEGSTLGSLGLVRLTLQFSPKSAGTVTRKMYVTATDSVGPRVISIKGSGIN